jgi:hypothetical protein
MTQDMEFCQCQMLKVTLPIAKCHHYQIKSHVSCEKSTTREQINRQELLSTWLQSHLNLHLKDTRREVLPMTDVESNIIRCQCQHYQLVGLSQTFSVKNYHFKP